MAYKWNFHILRQHTYHCQMYGDQQPSHSGLLGSMETRLEGGYGDFVLMFNSVNVRGAASKLIDPADSVPLHYLLYFQQNLNRFF